MPWSRYQEILKSIHFTAENTNDSCPKVGEVLDKLVDNYQKMYAPGENVMIDESLILWRGRLRFRQYIPSKTHRYGIKINKLTDTSGDTLNLKVYQGKDKQQKDIPAAASVCKKRKNILIVVEH